jgi:DNA-binding response OmpR family regulator
MPQALHSRPARIVVLDDDPDILSVVQEALQNEGYEVHAALQRGNAPALVRERQPDLVIINLMVSDRQDGLALLEQMKRDATLRQIPVLVCSAATTVLDQHETFLNEHAVHVIRKPFDLDELLAAVRQALEPGDRVRGRAPAERDAPDVELDVPRLRLDELTLDLDRLQAQLSLDARVANLLTLTAGADVSAERAALALRGLDGDLSLQVRLDNVAQIISRTLQTLDRNPGLMGRALGNVSSLPILGVAKNTNGRVVLQGGSDRHQNSGHRVQGGLAFADRPDEERAHGADTVEGQDGGQVHRQTTPVDRQGRPPVGGARPRPRWEATERPKFPPSHGDHREGRRPGGDEHRDWQARDAIQSRVHALQRRVARLEAGCLSERSIQAP